jgi:hypothetical protein
MLYCQWEDAELIFKFKFHFYWQTFTSGLNIEYFFPSCIITCKIVIFWGNKFVNI